jgi:hypothetical protein
VAIEADELYTKLVEQGSAALASAKEKLASDDKFGGALEVISANRIYGSLTELKKDLVSAERELNKDPQLKEIVKQAEALDRALALAVQKNATTKKSGLNALGVVMTRYPGTPAAELAEAKLTELGGEVPSETSAGSTAATGEFRLWTDATGKFRIEAELVSVVDGKVMLKKKEGNVITVPLDKLSAEDQEFLKEKEAR